jgi:signal transduction histidine kinase
MKRLCALLWQSSPLRTLLESIIVCCVLLIPMLPVLLDAPPLPFSLYLVQLPLLCSVVAGLRLRFFSGQLWQVLVKEWGFGLGLGLIVLGIVIGAFAGVGQMASIRFSYAGTGGTFFFLAMTVPEYLGMRFASWVWLRWDHLRRRRYAWALTHAILTVMGGLGLIILIGAVALASRSLGNDIWGIPTGDTFAQTVFWLTIIILFSSVIIAGMLVLLLPPATLFSFLVARRTTARLENLVIATQALRQGDLSSRVVLDGEDEIAQLQANFNAMATDLETSMLALQAEKDKVWSLLEARRELVAGISHELRNPTATILGYIESLRHGWEDRPSREVEHDLETIQYETERLQTILNDLLAASQIDADKLEINLQEVNVSALLARLVETFAGLAWSRKRVQVTLTGGQDDTVAAADPQRLEQVLVNLVQNAVQHTPPGGLVALEVHQESERVCIDVEDSGEGIAPEDLPHIWEKYHHFGASQKSIRAGTGLGLSLVKELTEAMGGSVSVESLAGQGSLFRVQLPAGPHPGEKSGR